MLAEPSHRLRLAPRAGQDGLADALGADQGERHLAALALVPGAIDVLAPAAAEEVAEDEAAGDDLRRALARGRCLGRAARLIAGRGLGRLERVAAGVAEPRIGTILVAAGRALHLGDILPCGDRWHDLRRLRRLTGPCRR